MAEKTREAFLAEGSRQADALLENLEVLSSVRMHDEALMLGFTAFVDPAGVKWNVTFREGAKATAALGFAVELHTISEQIVALGWTPQGVPWPPADVKAQQEKRIAAEVKLRVVNLRKKMGEIPPEQVLESAKDVIQEQVQKAVLKAHKTAIAEYAVLVGLMSNTRDIAGAEKLLELGAAAGLSTDDMVDKHDQWLKAVTAAVVKPKRRPPAKKAKQPRPPREQVPSRQAPSGGGQIKFEQIKIAAKQDGSPVIQFWRSGRKWPEISYSRSAESLLEMADQGFRDEFDEPDLDQYSIGQAYAYAGVVTWVPSENVDQNGRPYKNVSFVEST